jgi:hypothetical protein
LPRKRIEITTTASLISTINLVVIPSTDQGRVARVLQPARLLRGALPDVLVSDRDGNTLLIVERLNTRRERRSDALVD